MEDVCCHRPEDADHDHREPVGPRRYRAILDSQDHRDDEAGKAQQAGQDRAIACARKSEVASPIASRAFDEPERRGDLRDPEGVPAR